MGRSAEPAASAARSLFGDRGANTRLVVHSTPGSDRNENAVPQPAGTLSKLLISNLPLHSTANAWGNYGIFTTLPLPLSFVFKVDREPSLERELGRSRYLLNRSFYPGGAPTAFGALPGCTGGCADRARGL